MLIVAVNGSPNKDGNTAFLLKTAVGQLESMGVDSSILNVADYLADTTIPFCFDCSSPCEGICSQNTSLQQAAELLRKADGIILGSPVYFGTVSAQLKGFWDKVRFLRREQALLNTVGGAVTVGAGRFGGQETTIRALHDMMMVQGVIIVGDGYYTADPGHHGVCAQKPAQEDKDAIHRLEIMVKRIVQVAEATKTLRK